MKTYRAHVPCTELLTVSTTLCFFNFTLLKAQKKVTGIIATIHKENINCSKQANRTKEEEVKGKIVRRMYSSAKWGRFHLGAQAQVTAPLCHAAHNGTSLT